MENWVRRLMAKIPTKDRTGGTKSMYMVDLPGCVVLGPKAGDLVVCLVDSKRRAKLSGDCIAVDLGFRGVAGNGRRMAWVMPRSKENVFRLKWYGVSIGFEVNPWGHRGTEATL